MLHWGFTSKICYRDSFNVTNTSCFHYYIYQIRRDGSDEPLRQPNTAYSRGDTPCRGKLGHPSAGRFICMLPARLKTQFDELCDGEM